MKPQATRVVATEAVATNEIPKRKRDPRALGMTVLAASMFMTTACSSLGRKPSTNNEGPVVAAITATCDYVTKNLDPSQPTEKKYIDFDFVQKTVKINTVAKNYETSKSSLHLTSYDYLASTPVQTYKIKSQRKELHEGVYHYVFDLENVKESEQFVDAQITLKFKDDEPGGAIDGTGSGRGSQLGSHRQFNRCSRTWGMYLTADPLESVIPQG